MKKILTANLVALAVTSSAASAKSFELGIEGLGLSPSIKMNLSADTTVQGFLHIERMKGISGRYIKKFKIFSKSASANFQPYTFGQLGGLYYSKSVNGIKASVITIVGGGGGGVEFTFNHVPQLALTTDLGLYYIKAKAKAKANRDSDVSVSASKSGTTLTASLGAHWKF